MVRVYNKEEKKAFLASHRYRLNDCKVWWEDNHSLLYHDSSLVLGFGAKVPFVAFVKGDFDLLPNWPLQPHSLLYSYYYLLRALK
ncbi:unnamed protein product [Malus baccata var. baccata]